MSLRDTLSSAPLQSQKLYDIITTVRLFYLNPYPQIISVNTAQGPYKDHIMCGIALKNAEIP